MEVTPENLVLIKLYLHELIFSEKLANFEKLWFTGNSHFPAAPSEILLV